MKRPGKKPNRAIAIMTTLLVILFLTMLTGALIKTQSGAFALMRVSDRNQDARMACRGLYDYCLYELEHNRNWGAGGFATSQDVDPPRSDGADIDLNNWVTIESVDGDTIKGRLPDENLSFEIEVTNALTNGAAKPTDYGVSVANEQVGLRIEVGEKKHGKFSPLHTVSTVLALAPLFDGSVLTRGDLRIDGDEVFFASKDPRRNEVRSQGSADLPGLTRGDTRFLDFDPSLLSDYVDSGSAAFDGKGLLYSGKDVVDSGTVLDAAGQVRAAQRSGGRIVGNGKKRLDIYDLEPANIPQPPASALAHDVTVPPGEFRFTQVNANVEVEESGYDSWGMPVTTRTKTKQVIDVCAYFDPPGSSRPIKVMKGEVTAAKPNQKIISADLDPAPGETGTTPIEIGNEFYLDSSFDKADEHGIRSDKNGGSGPVVINLKEHSMEIAPNTRVRPESRPEGSPLPPSAFEIDFAGGKKPKFVLGTDSNDVILEADGDIKVGNGTTNGLGTIISKHGNVDLTPSTDKWHYEWVKNSWGYYELRAIKGVDIAANSQYEGLVVYAGKDVTIRNPDSAKWTVRGFVYANGKFNFDAANQNAVFFGSVISKEESEDGEPSFNLQRGKKLGFVYDPEYLKRLTRGLPHNWTRLEPVVWNAADS